MDGWRRRRGTHTGPRMFDPRISPRQDRRPALTSRLHGRGNSRTRRRFPSSLPGLSGRGRPSGAPETAPLYPLCAIGLQLVLKAPQADIQDAGGAGPVLWHRAGQRPSVGVMSPTARPPHPASPPERPSLADMEGPSVKRILRGIGSPLLGGVPEGDDAQRRMRRLRRRIRLIYAGCPEGPSRMTVVRRELPPV
jgi:hypothetical protein